jgi:hypothetical protein
MSIDPYFNSELRKFLEEHRTTKQSGGNGQISMTGMGAHKGSWYIPDEEYPKFLDLLNEYLFIDEFRPNNFVEQRKPDAIAPLLIDLDFKYNGEKNLQRTFTEKNINDFISEIIKTTNDHLKNKPNFIINTMELSNILCQKAENFSYKTNYESPFCVKGKEYKKKLKGGKADDITIIVAQILHSELCKY